MSVSPQIQNYRYIQCSHFDPTALRFVVLQPSPSEVTLHLGHTQAIKRASYEKGQPVQKKWQPDEVGVQLKSFSEQLLQKKAITNLDI